MYVKFLSYLITPGPGSIFWIEGAIKPGICAFNGHYWFKCSIYDQYGKKLPRLYISGAISDCLSIKKFYSGFKTSIMPDTNYFLVESATGAAVESAAGAAAESTTAGAGATVLSAAGVSSVFAASLQAAKDTDTIAKAKITFFILCFV